MGGECGRRHDARVDLPHHLRKIRWKRIAAGEQRRFPLVKFRVGKADIILHDAQQHIAAAMPDVGKPARDRGCMAGRIHDHVEELAVGEGRQFGLGLI